MEVSGWVGESVGDLSIFNIYRLSSVSVFQRMGQVQVEAVAICGDSEQARGIIDR